MNRTTGQGLSLLVAAVGLGILGDALLRPTPWGINLLLWTSLLLLTVPALFRRQQVAARGEGRWLMAPLLFFAASFAWCDSPTLSALNGLALLTALSLAALRTRAGLIRSASVTEYPVAVCFALVSALLGSFSLLGSDIHWKEIPRGKWSGAASAVGRGIAITLPLLLLFGGLFMAADEVFKSMVVRLFDWDLDELLIHLCLIGSCAWITAGVLRLLFLEKQRLDSVIEEPRSFSLGIVEVSVVLGALNTLFLAFVLVQFRYFFGGALLVHATTGLTYAQYARRGFFELVTVTALVLPVLLLMHWLLRKENPLHERLFRVMTGALTAMLFVIMASAIQRMRLYQNAYGITELRLYVTVFMGWLAVVFLWFIATVLRGQREQFAFGALVAAFLAIAILDRFNPDTFIVRTNAVRAAAAQSFDEQYVTSLSADAVPELLKRLPALPEAKRRAIAAALLARWSPPAKQDWRTWNWSRAQAWQAVKANQVLLRQTARPTVQMPTASSDGEKTTPTPVPRSRHQTQTASAAAPASAPGRASGRPKWRYNGHDGGNR